jgi:hypothetical protein
MSSKNLSIEVRYSTLENSARGFFEVVLEREVISEGV